jgi:hypothetical protein
MWNDFGLKNEIACSKRTVQNNRNYGTGKNQKNNYRGLHPTRYPGSHAPHGIPPRDAPHPIPLPHYLLMHYSTATQSWKSSHAPHKSIYFFSYSLAWQLLFKIVTSDILYGERMKLE